MIDYTALYTTLTVAGAEAWAQQLPQQLQQAFNPTVHGDLPRWQQAIADLPNVAPSVVELCQSVSIGRSQDLTASQQQALETHLRHLHPWRKGPYRLFDLLIDTEWRSDWKWERIQAHIAPLQNRLVLDVGCGNGYHGWRMLGAGARFVLGIDPGMLSVMQFMAIRRLHGEAPFFVLPLGIEAMPPNLQLFDTVFSMGVLYHRRSPLDHLLELKGCLRPGGEVVLETLVIAGDANQVLMPDDRYAQMRNVWFLPSCEALLRWMQRCGFKNARVVSVNKTGCDEQRSTDWMRFHSLRDFLDPNNPNLTCEGLPAPLRAVVVATV